MNTASGSSGSLADSEDSSSTSAKVIEMLRLLDSMDDCLITSCREARISLGNPETFPVTNDDFLLLADAKRRYRDADYSMEEVSFYLLRLPALDKIWENVCRGILRHFPNDPAGEGEWRVWLSQVERAGSLAWQQTLDAAYFIFKNTVQEGRMTMMNAIIQKFTVVDEGLDEVHRRLFGNQRLVRFSVELRDSVNALITIAEQRGVVTAEAILRFKTAARTQKAAAEARWTGNHQEPAAGDPGQLRRRRLALDHQAVEDNQDRAEGRAILPGRIEADASRQYDPTVLVLVGLLSIAAAALTTRACILEDQIVGSHNDADFWFLVQSSLLQLAGMIPVTVALWFSNSTSLQPRFWSWFFLVIGVICSFLSPILYLTVPKQASGAVAYVGGVSQAFIVLEAMFLAQRAVRRDEAGERAR